MIDKECKHSRSAFLFDLDGVIIDSEREYSRIWAAINREFPTGVPDLERVIKGCTLDKILEDFFPGTELRGKVVERLYELEGKMRYVYLPGAESLLDSLNNEGIPAVLVTSSNDDKMRHLREELPGLESKFRHIVTANQVSRSKPDPEGYLIGASMAGCRPQDCFVFEDSIQGVKAGRNAGSYVIGVAGTNPRSALEPYSDMVVDSLEEIDIYTLLNVRKDK